MLTNYLEHALRHASPHCVRRGGAAAAQTPKKGGILNFGVVAEPPNYDCHGSTTFALVHPIAPHYSLLVKFDGKDYPKVIPDLAESWTVAPDKHDLHLQAAQRRQIPRRLAADVGGHQGQLRPHHQPARGRGLDPQGLLRGSDRRDARPDHSRLQAEEPDGGRDGGPASPFNCIYSAAKLKQNPRYPETEIMGSGAFTFVEHVKGSTWEGKRFDGYFNKERPYLDGYKIFFVKSAAVVPGILGGQFDAEFRGRNPPRRGSFSTRPRTTFGLRGHVGEQPDAGVQHHAQALR